MYLLVLGAINIICYMVLVEAMLFIPVEVLNQGTVGGSLITKAYHESASRINIPACWQLALVTMPLSSSLLYSLLDL